MWIGICLLVLLIALILVFIYAIVKICKLLILGKDNKEEIEKKELPFFYMDYYVSSEHKHKNDNSEFIDNWLKNLANE